MVTEPTSSAALFNDVCSEKEFTPILPHEMAGMLCLHHSDYEVEAEPQKVDNSSNIEVDDLIALLVGNVCGEGWEVEVEEWKPSSPRGYVYLYAFNDWPDKPHPHCYVQIGHDNKVAIPLLIDAMRTSGIPLVGDREWITWDAIRQRLVYSPQALEATREHARPLKADESLSKPEQRVLSLLRRAVWSTDHGKKPLIVPRDESRAALQCKEIPFLFPATIVKDSLAHYELAFYDGGGQIASLPLEEAAALGYPIVTRSSTYCLLNGDMVPHLSEARLAAGAFLLAAKFNPNEFAWFQVRNRGTLFHSAIDRVEPPRDPRVNRMYSCSPGWAPSQRLMFNAETDTDAIAVAVRLVEASSEYGEVYLTDGAHPIESEFVTTPQHYLRALQILLRNGRAVYYSKFCAGVTIATAKFD